MSKKIGILTSGGDCAGLNALIRAVTHAACHLGWSVIGIKQGIHGLNSLSPDYVDLDYGMSGYGPALLQMGGTFLGTAHKGNPFEMKQPDGTTKDISDDIIKGYNSLGLDALIGVGGDGSLSVLRRLAQKGNIPFIGVPKTIDNDIGFTESLGFMTSVNVATEALDRLQPTAASHSRVMILEVMGRDVGHIALHAGIAGGADIILIPEMPFNLEAIIQKIKDVNARKRHFSLIIVSEAATPEGLDRLMLKDAKGKPRYGGIGHYLCHMLDNAIEAEVRATVLGHVQRGGSPTARDRILAASFGAHAIELIKEGKSDRMVAWHNGAVVNFPLDEAIRAYKPLNKNNSLVKAARELGISFGTRSDLTTA